MGKQFVCDICAFIHIEPYKSCGPLLTGPVPRGSLYNLGYSVLDKSWASEQDIKTGPRKRKNRSLRPADGTKTTRDFVFTFTPQHLLWCILTIDPIWLLLSFNFVHHRRPTNGACVPRPPFVRTGSGASWNTVTQQTFTIIRSRTWCFLCIVCSVHGGATWIGDSVIETGCADWVNQRTTFHTGF